MNKNAILGLSIGLNLALAVLLLRGRIDPGSAAADSRARESVSPPPAAAPAVVESKSKTQVVTNQVTRTFDWHMVESEDYKQYIANLRAIGCPEETIRDIIIADVNKLFESRRKALRAERKFEYWKAGNMFAGLLDEELTQKKEQLAAEKRAILKELLGIEIEEQPENAIAGAMDSMLDFLSDEKQTKVNEIVQKFQARMLQSVRGGVPDAEDFGQLLEHQKELEAELAKVLTPQELEDYQLRMSQTAMMMRMQLGAFDPNEQEFREIFRLRKALDDEFGLMGMAARDKAARERMQQAQKEMNETLKSRLGPERYTQYERSQDFRYQGLVKIVDRNGLPRTAADQVYEMDKVSQREIQRLRTDQNLSAEKRDEAIRAVKEETQRSIREVLGDRAYQSYTNRGGLFGVPPGR